MEVFTTSFHLCWSLQYCMRHLRFVQCCVAYDSGTCVMHIVMLTNNQLLCNASRWEEEEVNRKMDRLMTVCKVHLCFHLSMYRRYTGIMCCESAKQEVR